MQIDMSSKKSVSFFIRYGNTFVLIFERLNKRSNECDTLAKAKGTSGHVEFAENEMNDMISIFKTLSDTSRIRIISVLSKQEGMSVGDIAKHLDLEISLVSHHLSTLRLYGFVKPRKEKKQVFYSIDDDCIIDIMQRARDHVAGN